MKVFQSIETFCDPMDYNPQNFPGQDTGVDTFPSLGYLPNPGVESRSIALKVDSLPAEPQG